MNNLTAEEAELGEWFASRCTELGVVCVADYPVSDIRWPAYLPSFGGVNGMVVGSIEFGYPEPGSLYYSLVNPIAYLGATKEKLIETLNDWGWCGALEDRPAWYSGAEWGAIAQPRNPADA